MGLGAMCTPRLAREITTRLQRICKNGKIGAMASLLDSRPLTPKQQTLLNYLRSVGTARRLVEIAWLLADYKIVRQQYRTTETWRLLSSLVVRGLVDRKVTSHRGKVTEWYIAVRKDA